MVWAGREVRSRTEYILGTYHRLFWNLYIQDPIHNSDHYLVLGYLCSSSLREKSEYVRRRKKTPLRPPTTPTRKDGFFADLQRAVPKPKARDARKNAWISEATWRLVDERVSALQDPADSLL